VDDEPQARELVAVYLEDRDYTVRTVATAEEAMRQLD
jgi:DNA-binding response OmpR family regulator